MRRAISAMPPVAAHFVVGLDMVVINTDVLQRFCMSKPRGAGTDYEHFVASIVHNYALTENQRHSPSTPSKALLPASSNKMPEPATRSLTVRDASTTPGSLTLAILRDRSTAKPL